MARRRLDAEAYTVGWICALPIELAAAQMMLDEEHLPHHGIDSSQYTLGCISNHNIVLSCLPAGQMGIGAAAFSAGQTLSKFRSIRFGLMVGVGGGVPSAEDVRLGDVVISQPVKQHGGVVQYDFGRTGILGLMTRTGSLNAPPKMLLNAVAQLRALRYQDRDSFATHLSIFDRNPRFSRDKAGPDVLFEATYTHNGGATCSQCRVERIQQRAARESGEEVTIHYGMIASGNQVMKDGLTRDRLSKELGGVLCFEMEAAGLMNDFPCLVIRGISDYADSHKNKTWQPYAAATAAACAKAILSLVPADDMMETKATRELDKRPISLGLRNMSMREVTDQSQVLGALRHTIPHISSTQAEDIYNILDDIRGQVSQLPSQLAYSQRTSLPRSNYVLHNGRMAEHSSPLQESIERLQSEVSREEKVHNEEAESFIDDLECVIHSISALPKDPSRSASRLKVKMFGESEVVSSREMKRLCGIISSSHGVGLNVGRKLQLCPLALYYS
jgi:nucleoside phosphorylase